MESAVGAGALSLRSVFAPPAVKIRQRRPADDPATLAAAIRRNYTEVSYNSTVVNNRWFCAGGGGVAQSILVAAATVCDPGFRFWTVGTHYDWFPLPGLRFAVDVMYTGIETAMDGEAITLQTKQGDRPSGVYTAKNLGNVSVIFRAQRSWGAGD